MALAGVGKVVLACSAAVFLAACEEGANFNLFENLKAKGDSADGVDAAAPEAQGTTIEREVEAPEIFQSQESALWDGRPSLGGIWVAHPNVTDPQRVMIRNLDNGKFVIGALFRRERENPGPRLQVSSDAAAELGLLAGSPVQFSVVALKRETIVIEPEIEMAEPANPEGEIEATSLASMAASAIEEATEGTASASASAATATPAPRPAASSSSKLEKPFIQIGIYSVEANANQTAELLRASGVVPSVKSFTSNDKPYWRVIVGPASSSSDRSAVLKKIKGLGFGDAYPVTN